MPSCLPQSSLRFPLVTLCVRLWQVCAGVCACVCMCLYVCDWECAAVFRRCCFPQPRSNSVVTQSPCERFPASVLPPVGRLSLAGWVAECVWQRPTQSHWAPLSMLLPPIRIDLLCQPLGLSAAAALAAVHASCVHILIYLSFSTCWSKAKFAVYAVFTWLGKGTCLNSNSHFLNVFCGMFKNYCTLCKAENATQIAFLSKGNVYQAPSI